MSITYLDVVNAVLRDTNEVPLNTTNFANARGFHAYLKEAVNRSLMDMANYTAEWPWLANLVYNPEVSAHSNEIETDRRVAIYEFPEGISGVDWDTFVLTDMRGREASSLTPISYEEWAHYGHADVLSNRTNEDIGTPTVIYRTKDGKGFGLSPVPDKAYRIQFNSWGAPALLVNPTDPIPFPERYYTVLVHRARYYAWMFRENVDQARIARDDYSDGIKRMQRDLIKPIYTRMRAV
ncbi:tail protein [Vibrio phage CHOED]|uniref:tail protein n=1 Tax=Vibrio phage CHOED TaxID=1458716 RepID=UPI00042E3E93|nr:tail protein [Vibrio phage CHOED]AHK11865.1 hypothetical protein CHOED_05 [Vibrio phage CHOED]